MSIDGLIQKIYMYNSCTFTMEWLFLCTKPMTYNLSSVETVPHVDVCVIVMNAYDFWFMHH